MYNDKKMKAALESMMFVLGDPLDVKDAAAVLDADKMTVRRLLEELRQEYEEGDRGIRIREIDGSYQWVTDPENAIFIEKLCTPVRVRRLSQAALEVLAIIAYRQPVTRSEIDAIRGIKSERVLDGLENRGLIEEAGRSEGVGRPILYRTTREFLRLFGFRNLDELPDIQEFAELKREDGRAEENGAYQQVQLVFDLTGEEEDKMPSEAAEEEKGEADANQ